MLLVNFLNQNSVSTAYTRLGRRSPIQNTPQAASIIPLNQGLAFKHRIRFGNDSSDPKLTYTQTQTYQDPLIGNIRKFQFSNGMELYAIANKRKDITLGSFGTLVRTGLRNETEEDNGISHFLEHLAFKGTANHPPGELDRLFENEGASINAWTSEDGTFFYLYDIPEKRLLELVPYHAEMMQNLLIPGPDLESERGVVCSEIDQYADDIEDVMQNALNASIWPTSPYGRPILGPASNIRTFSRQDILNAYATHYAPPNRAMVVICPEEMIPKFLDTVAASYNKPFPPQGGEPAGEERTYSVSGETLSSESKELPSTGALLHQTLHHPNLNGIALYTMAVEGPKPLVPSNEKAVLAADLLTTILGGTKSSRLYQRLVEKEKLATSIKMWISPNKEHLALMLNAQTTPDKLDRLKAGIQKELVRVSHKGVTKSELRAARLMAKKEVVDTVEIQWDLLTSIARAISHNSFGKTMLGAKLALLDTITSDDLKQIAQQYLQPNAQHSVTMLPEEASAEPSTDMPRFSGARRPRFAGTLKPGEHLIALDGGSQLVVHPDKDLLKTAVSLRLKTGGTIADRIPGETDILSYLMQRGTATLSATALQKRLGQHCLDLDITSWLDNMTLTISGLPEKKNTMFKVLGDLLHGPTVHPQELAFVADHLRQEAQKSQAKPEYMASVKLREALFSQHPYGITLINTIVGNLPRFTSDGLLQSFHRLFTKPNITASVVGQITPDEAQKRVTALLSNLSDTPVTEQEYPFPVITQNETRTHLDPALQQLQVRRGWMIPSSTLSDKQVPLEILQSILSGGMSARLFQTFREGKRYGKGLPGLCYGVGAELVSMEQGGYFQLETATEPQNTELVQRLFDQEMDDIRNNLATEEEMARARLVLEDSWVSGLQEPADIAGNLTDHIANKRDSAVDQLPKIGSVTAEQVREAARDLFAKPSVTVLYGPSDPAGE
jgi:zinc protease